MTTEFVLSVLGLLGVSNIITFFLTKRRYNTEVEAQQIANISTAFDVHKKVMHESLESQKQMLNEKIVALQKENEELKRQVEQLQQQLFELMRSEVMSKSRTSKK